MKKSFKFALGYLIFGLCIGIFNHEIAYYTHFEGKTVLSLVHGHAFVLGTTVFLLLPLFIKVFHIDKMKDFKKFFVIYNMGLICSLLFMSIRGIMQLYQMNISSFADHMIGGLAGIGHVILTIGIYFFFKLLFAIKEA